MEGIFRDLLVLQLIIMLAECPTERCRARLLPRVRLVKAIGPYLPSAAFRVTGAMADLHQFKGFSNVDCEFYPCHKGINRDFNCLFCYCPLMERECPGPYQVFTDKYGNTRKDCSECTLPHDGIEQSWRFIQMWIATAPAWDKTPQSAAKTKKYAQLVKATFDQKDIQWATTRVEGDTEDN